MSEFDDVVKVVKLLQDHAQTLQNLADTQTRCNELLEETRDQRRQMDELRSELTAARRATKNTVNIIESFPDHIRVGIVAQFWVNGEEKARERLTNVVENYRRGAFDARDREALAFLLEVTPKVEQRIVTDNPDDFGDSRMVLVCGKCAEEPNVDVAPRLTDPFGIPETHSSDNTQKE